MKFILMAVLALGFTGAVHAEDLELRLACRAASRNMPDGSGATVYYPNGRTLTSNAGKSGATWYYPNGRTISSNIAIQGATYYYANGRTFSSNTGVEGATWYYANGRTITSNGPALSVQEMAELACDLIQIG